MVENQNNDEYTKMQEANYALAKPYLDDIITNDWSDENLKKFAPERITLESVRRWKKENPTKWKKKEIVSIELPNNGKLISEFADELAKKISPEKILFYRPDTRKIVEIGKIKHDDGKDEYSGFIELSSHRFITIIERYFRPWCTIYTKKGELTKYRSLTQTDAKIVIESDNFRDNMPLVNRIFTAQIPIIYNGQLTFPNKGYDKRFSSWLSYDSPVISNPEMTLEEAKKIILYIFQEFCFQCNQDYVNAIAGLMTPFLRGLFPSFTTRTPIFIYEANRERAGKDYLAGLTGILYEGKALEEPPISDGEFRSSGKNDELKKKILAALLYGRKRLHFANNKGHLNNSVLEAVTTAKEYSDRVLGRNDIVTLPNELDFSLSGNLGITLTPDLANRSRFVKLFLEMEDANSRPFNNPDLHGWLLNNRETVLSALFAFVREWISKGSPKGSIPFTSFPEWAEICGGILECCGFGSPCVKDKGLLGNSVDAETDEMKSLFELLYDIKPDKWLSKSEIKMVIQQYADDLFNYMNWENRSDQTKFAVKLNKFVGRMLSDVKLTVQDSSIRPARWLYKFTKNVCETEKSAIFGQNCGNLGNLGNLLPSPEIPYANTRNNIESSHHVTNVTNVTKPDFFDELKQMYQEEGKL